jgi:membrane protease YdiL (CAAX protease family)
VIEQRYPTRFCPYCSTEITSPTKYCVKCGAEITWSIKQAQDPPYPWTPKSTYIITIITYGFSLLLTFALLFYYLIFFGIPLLQIEIILVADPFFMFLLTLSSVVFFLVPFAYVRRLRVGRDKLGIVAGGALTLSKDVLLGLGVGAALVPLGLFFILNQLLALGVGPPVTPPSPVELFWAAMLCLAVILVVAPAEEVLFRGFMQNSLDAYYGRIGGVLVTSIIFGLLHLNPFIGIVQTIVGLFLGLLFQWRGRRLTSPIVAHAAYDCILILIEVFFF